MPLKTILRNDRNLERILDSLQEGIIAHDMQRRVFFFNREAEQITGYPREDVLDRDCHDVFGFPFCGNRCDFCSDSPPQRGHESRTMTIVTKTGEQRRVEMSVTLMRDENETPMGVLASFRDVTDLIRLQISAGKLTKFADIVGQDIKMLEIFQQITDLAEYDYPAHIYGETGTGKELVAAAIHNEGRRAGAPFVPINCGALPENLIESELFGHVRGSFSGAIRDKKGRFELAHNGTVFLDEVAELPKSTQVKLLRFLQEGTFEPVGGEKTASVDVRIISATNKDLRAEIAAGRFREDLFYRLSVIPIHLPPLRERKIDIPLLIGHFLQETAERYDRDPLSCSDDAISLMLDYPWPGNVRELQNALQFTIVKSNGRMIRPADLPAEIRDYRVTCAIKPSRTKLSSDAVTAALTQTDGNKAKAARLLGVGRATLYRFLDQQNG